VAIAFAKGRAAGAEGVPAMNRAVRKARVTRHIAVPPALDGIPNVYYAGMYDIVKKTAYTMRC
jgi:hypothetical protein